MPRSSISGPSRAAAPSSRRHPRPPTGRHRRRPRSHPPRAGRHRPRSGRSGRRRRGTAARQVAEPVLGRGCRPASRRRRRGRGRAGPTRPARPPRGSIAVRKRCTRPSKFVNVPSRSTHAAAGSTQWARSLVALALVPVKIDGLHARQRLGHLAGRPARGRAGRGGRPTGSAAGPRGRRSGWRRCRRQADQLGAPACSASGRRAGGTRRPRPAPPAAPEAHLLDARAAPARAAGRSGPRWPSAAEASTATCSGA